MLPSLTARTTGGITVLTDEALSAEHGVLVTFTQREGGRSVPPYDGLDLASHVGDDPAAVDENRSALLASLGIGPLRSRLTMAEQVHGCTVRVVAGATAGMGAYARAGGPPPVPATDALVTTEEETPLMLCYADCVPVVLVATGAVRGVAVAHAGWRGALGRIPAEAATRLAAETGSEPSDLVAYIGPHIGSCCYEVDATLLSQFVHTFGTIAAAQGRLDLGAVVSESLIGVGVPLSSQVRANICTAERTDAFYSYRAEGRTGRHAALACILEAHR
jgi:YfiH family protein